MTKSQIFFWLLMAFVVGIALASFVRFSVAALGALLALGGAVAAFGLLELVGRERVVVAGFVLIAFALGALRFLATEVPSASPLAARVGERITVRGLVVAEPMRRPQSQELTLRAAESGERMFIRTRPFPEYGYGDRLRLVGRLATEERPDGRSALGMAFPDVAVLARGEGSPLFRRLLAVKTAFARGLRAHLPEPEGSFLAGLLLGERQDFPLSLRDDLRTTGTAHIVALSGYNITIIADNLLKALAFVAVPPAAAFWAAAGGIIAFVAVTGAAASAVRAAVMGVLVLVAKREGRIYRARNAIALAAAGMLLADPRLLRFDLGFQLSFLATLGLIYLAPALERWLAGVHRRWGARRYDADFRWRPGRLAGIAITTIAAQFAVLPLLVYRFGELSLVAPFVNLVILPFVPATMFAGFLTGLASLVSATLGRIAAAPAWILGHAELSAIAFFARLPGAGVGAHGVATFLAAVFALLLVVALFSASGRRPLAQP